MNINPAVVAVAVAVATLGSCGVQEHTRPSAGLAAFTPHVAAAATDVAPTSSTADLSVTLQIVHGRFLGIGVGSSLADALRTLGVTPVVAQVGQPSGAIAMHPCLAGGEHWVIDAAGLSLMFEGPSAGAAKLTTWQYTGGPTIGFTQLVAPHGITIGSTRSEVLEAYDTTVEIGDAIEVDPPVALQFGLSSGAVAWFGDVSCAPDPSAP